ncbi:MAG: helix-turn-helix domain-containing protein [Rhodomicrobium sp.]
MISTHENPARVSHNGSDVTECLRAFMRTHRLSLEELATVLRTSEQTLDDWFNEGTPPPGCLLALMVLFGTAQQVPGGSGVHSSEEALRRVRAI